MPDQAEPMLRKALPIYEHFYDPNSLQVASMKETLGTAIRQQGQYKEAESLLKEQYRTLRANPGVDSKHLEKALNHLIGLYETWQKPELAEKYRQALSSG